MPRKRRVGVHRLRLAVPALLLISSACGGAASTGLPTPALSTVEIQGLADSASAFAHDHLEAWPDIDSYLAEYTDDYSFADPTWADYRVGSENVIAMLRMWASLTDYTVDVTAAYVSENGAAFEESWPGLQPPMMLPPDPPVASGLVVYTFENGRVRSEDLWYRASDNVAYGIGCFAVDDCPALRETVDAYVTAWASGDSRAIAALYSEDAAFSDSMLGLDASGSTAIGELARSRFGPARVTIEVLDVYAWTNDTTPPSARNADAGRLIGVAIHYRATAPGTAGVQDAVVTLELGVRTNRFEADPQGLIHREVVYHSPEALLNLVAAGSGASGS